MKRVLHIIVTMTIGLLFSGVVQAGDLPLAQDFPSDAKKAQVKGIPIMVFFKSETCEYCEVVHELYLGPMFHDEAYKNKVMIRVVDVDGGETLRDFDGRQLDHEEFADQESASFTPIIKWYGPSGKELVSELVGYSSPDFYLKFLERSIEIATNKIKSDKLTSKLD